MKKAAIFDLDKTLIDKHIWTGLMKYNFKTRENLFSVFWYIIVHMGLFPLWKTRLLPENKYFYLWGKNISWMIKGMSEKRVQEIFNLISQEYLFPSFKENVLKKLKEHQDDNFLTILISGNFQNLLEIIGSKLNFDFVIGTKLETNNGKFTGKIIPPLCFEKNKKKKFDEFLSEQNLKINFPESFAYADSIHDLPILKLVGNPVAVNPDKKLLKIARQGNWQIIF